MLFAFLQRTNEWLHKLYIEAQWYVDNCYVHPDDDEGMVVYDELQTESLAFHITWKCFEKAIYPPPKDLILVPIPN